MSAVLQRIAALANGLTKAELHVLIELAARAQMPTTLETTASSRELAQKTGLARASVQTAIDSLNTKQLIRSGPGTATQPAVHRLLCLEPVENPADDVTAVPEVAQELGQGGSSFRPPYNGKSAACESAHTERANARADSIEKHDFEKTIDRLLKAKKSDYDESLFELARNTIASHHARFARPENRLPGLPDDGITAQFLAVAEWPKLSDLLSDLAAERKEAGHSYGWYVTVALQRIRGISPEQVRDMRCRRKNPDNKRSGPLEPMQPMSSTNLGQTARRLPSRRQTQAVSSAVDMDHLRQQIRSVAAAKSLR